MNYVKSSMIKVYDEESNRDIWFKCDFELPTGSFKYREAYELDKLLSKFPNIKRVVTTSSGNSAHAFAELERRSHGLVKVTCFWWGNGTTREEANLQAYKLYMENDATTTLGLFGKNMPLKIAAHAHMAEEIAEDLSDRNETLGWYYQTSGSGYGCRAIAKRFPNADVIYCRPESEYNLWAPAITDAPMLTRSNLNMCVPHDLIKKAFEHLNTIFKCTPRVGLEAATALAGYWAGPLYNKSLDNAVVINLTGVLRGEVPW
jgi:hypothetical protein